MKLGTRQLDTSLLETQVSKGIRNMRNMAELWKSKNQLIQIMTDVYIKLVIQNADVQCCK